MTLLTIGHGTLGRAALGALLSDAGVEQLVDVRRFPGSRANADVLRGALECWLPHAGVAYRWEPRLGGRRRLTKEQDTQSPDQWWRVAAFRAYAGYTRTPDFRAAMAQLLDEVAQRRLAIMCSESVWWRCHRRLIADVTVLTHGVPVGHLMHSGVMTPHVPSEGARTTADGALVWDGRAGG